MQVVTLAVVPLGEVVEVGAARGQAAVEALSDMKERMKMKLHLGDDAAACNDDEGLDDPAERRIDGELDHHRVER